jgi:inorganic pyrophosphatase
VRVLGAIRLRKNGIENDRFITAPQPAPGRSLPTDQCASLADLESHTRAELEKFLCGYSESQGNVIELVGAVEVEEAMDLIQAGHKAFVRKNG